MDPQIDLETVKITDLEREIAAIKGEITTIRGEIDMLTSELTDHWATLTQTAQAAVPVPGMMIQYILSRKI